MNENNWFLPVAAGAAGLLTATLVGLQSDFISRKVVLTPKQLQRKRRAEYVFRWQQALERAVLRIKYAWAGGAIRNYSPEEEAVYTVVYVEKDEADELFDRILKASCDTFTFLRAGLDSTRNSQDRFVWISELQEHDSGRNILHQVRFDLLSSLANKLDREVATTTFCFVADASAGVGTSLLLDLLNCVVDDEDVFVVRNPFWMSCIAVLSERQAYRKETLELVFLALCQMQARGHPAKTVIVTLPGQAMVPQLLRLVYTVFPSDRLVFLYSSCIHAVAKVLFDPDYAPSQQIPKTLRSALEFRDQTIDTAPLAPGRLIESLHVMEPFHRALAALPGNQADVVQTWMSAVETYLLMKEEDGTKAEFLPFCCKLEFLLDQSDVSLEEKDDAFWSLRSLLQYTMGTKSRPFSDDKMLKAVNRLRQAQVSWRTWSKKDVCTEAIQNAVFQHKLILIENKTLKDTVLPAEHWTLKAAVKRGCACCLVEGEDEDDTTTTLELPSFASGVRKRNPGGYVDGKATFAFDPTRFS